MQFIFAIVLCFLIGFIFWFIGHVARKELKINEESLLLSLLINISLGASCFLILVNLISMIVGSYLIGLIVFFAATIALIAWQFQESKKITFELIEIIKTNKLVEIIEQNTSKYFWILIGITNFLYVTTAISTTKLDRFGQGNTHIFNITQIVSDIFPPKYSFMPTVTLRSHYGADIFAATISKITGLNPEISLDILTVLFLNLAFLAVYGLALKFLNSKNINKYLVLFGVFLAWGPIAYLFTKDPGEFIPQKFLDKIVYLTQNKLIDSASWSGLVFHWFFEPSSGISIFFFLIALYLMFRFFSGDDNLKFTILLGILLSSFVIIDFTKFVILLFGILLHLLFVYVPQGNVNKVVNETEFLKKLGILFLTTILLGVIHGNCLRFDKNFIPFTELYKFGHLNFDQNFNLRKTNVILLIIYGFGFFQAFKQKQNWLIFILPYFIASIIIPSLITLPNFGTGKFLMSANILGAFTLPIVIDFIESKFEFKEWKQIAFYSLVFIIFGVSTLMFWAFGDKIKPLFSLQNGSLKYSGVQAIASTSFDESKYRDESTFTAYLRSKRVKNQSIVTDPEYNEVFTTNTGLISLVPPMNVNENPIKKEALDQSFYDYRKSFFFDRKAWLDKKINWFYLTPRMFRYLLFPQSRKIFLNAYLNKGVKLALSNKKTDQPEELKELYEIDPHLFSITDSENFPSLLEQALSTDLPYYIKQIALCPYFGIYNAKSNDFDGDKIADLAFFDHTKNLWYIIYGKDGHEAQIDLTSNILAGYRGSDLFIPVPSDYDGDSKTDIALFNRTSATWHILKSSNSQVEPPKTWCGDWSETPIPADIDKDSKADFSCFCGNDGRWPTFLTSTNNYYVNNFGVLPLDITLYSDVDGDKKADYLIYRPSQGIYYVHLASCLKTGSGIVACGAAARPDIVQVTLGEISSRAVPEDYDGDGKVDLGTWTPESGKWEISFARNFLINKTGIVQKTVTLGKAGDIPMPGDYNGDGRAEIAVYHISNSELEILYDGGASKKIDLSKYKNYIPANFIGI